MLFDGFGCFCGLCIPEEKPVFPQVELLFLSYFVSDNIVAFLGWGFEEKSGVFFCGIFFGMFVGFFLWGVFCMVFGLVCVF